MGDKQSLPTRPMVISVVQTVACSLRGRGGKNLVHCMVLEGPSHKHTFQSPKLGMGCSELS